MAIFPHYANLLLTFLTICFFLLFYWQNRTSRLINWPIVGMLPAVLHNSSRVYDFVTDNLIPSGGTFLFKGPWFCGFNFFMICDPTNLRHILSKNSANYCRVPEFNEIFEPMGAGLINSVGDVWRLQRRLVHSFIKHPKFELGVEKIMQERILHALFSILDLASGEGAEVDLQDVFRRFIFDNSCQLTLGIDANCLSIGSPHVPFQQAFDQIQDSIFYRHILPRWVWKMQKRLQIGEEKKLKKSGDLFDHFLYQCISRKRKQIEMKDFGLSLGLDFLTYVLLDENETEDDRVKGVFRNSDKLLRDITFSLLLAGDTVVSSLSWLFWLLATHSFAENKIREEIKENLVAEGDERKQSFFPFEELKKLKKLIYLHATICEALRLYPPIPFEEEVSVGPDILPSGHHVPPKTRVLYSLYSVGRMEEIWGEDCLEFKPERWITEEGGIKRMSSYKFIAFNAGSRNCLGKDLAFLQMKAVASVVIWNYHIHVVENHPVNVPTNSLILRMRHGLKVRVSKRQC